MPKPGQVFCGACKGPALLVRFPDYKGGVKLYRVCQTFKCRKWT